MLARVSQHTEGTSQLDANLAKQLAWLLREDLRNTFKTIDNPAFGDWWLIKGRQEYPAWAYATPEQELQPLFESAGKATIAGVSVDVPKVVQQLARYRGDAVREYTRDGKLDNEKFFAWAIVRGLAEHHLAVYAPRHLQAMLDMPVLRKDIKNETAEVPAITLLMYLLWSLMDEATQKALDIYTVNGTKAFLPWFFNVVDQLSIVPLIAGRWKSWVKTQPNYKGPQLTWASAAPSIPLPSIPTNKADKPFGVNLYGFAYGELGIGEDLRMAVACCEVAKIPYYIVNVDAGNIRQADYLLKGKTNDLDNIVLPPYRNNIFCLPAFDTASRIFMQKGPSLFNGYHNIGWWPWELDVFPENWKSSAFKLVDELWASSKYVMDAYTKATDKKVFMMPISVDVNRCIKRKRSYFNLPDEKFIFLYVFDFNSNLVRKNPFAAILAFIKAFPNTESDVILVLKVINHDEKSEVWVQLKELCRKDNRIILLTSTFERGDILALINIVDAYISLHRSEGFGRTLVEAMLLGKFVIATNYSGNSDYMNVNYNFPVNSKVIPVRIEDYYYLSDVDAASWAEPSVEIAAEIMKSLIQKNNLPKPNEIIKFAKNLYSPNVIGPRMLKKLISN